MKLSKAVSLQVEYGTILNSIRVDKDGYMCLNDMVTYFPGTDIHEWHRLPSTKKFIDVLEKFENDKPGKSRIIKFECIRTKRGKGGGTWAHKDLAFEFAMWLSPEFKLHVIRSYQEGTQHKQDWNVKRIMAAANFRLMTDSIKESLESKGKEPKFYHYCNEALMLNEIVFGVRQGDVRDTATEVQLEAISMLEMHNATFLSIGWEYENRKETLKDIYNTKIVKKLESYKSEL
jgi:hypothetical protein